MIYDYFSLTQTSRNIEKIQQKVPLMIVYSLAEVQLLECPILLEYLYSEYLYAVKIYPRKEYGGKVELVD